MRTALTLLPVCLAATVTAADPQPQRRHPDVTLGFRFGIGAGPSFEFEHARNVRGTTEMAVELISVAMDCTRAGGPLWGLEITSAEGSRSSGADEHVGVGTVGIVLGWAFRLPQTAIHLEAAAMGGAGTLTLERSGEDIDDVYRQAAVRLGAYWTHGEWVVGLEGRYEYGFADLDDIDGAGTDSRLRHRGGVALAVLGFHF
jgi:hypothetical protein